jgi:outer membrane protein assembly factor BamB
MSPHPTYNLSPFSAAPTINLSLWRVSASCLFFALGLAVPCFSATPFTDPAPPTVQTTSTHPPKSAAANPEATFNFPTQPLPQQTVISDWPSFLGPNHDMTSPETGIRRDFPTDGLKPVWEMKKGEGYAAPAVVGDRLILFHRIGDSEVVDCLHPTDGRRYWQFRSPTTYRDRYGYNPGPRSSPVIDPARNLVFTFGAEGKLHCLDLLTGEVRWRRDLHQEFGIAQNFFGVGTSPLLDRDRLIVNLGAPGGPSVAAFDVLTGRMVWGAEDRWGASYASPIPGTLAGKRRVFVLAGGESKPPTGGLLCLDPDNGQIDFRFPWRGTRYESVNAASPVVIGDNQVFISECYGSGGTLLAAQPDGTVKQLWQNKTFGMHFMTALRIGDHLYGVHGHGPQDAELVCVELATGREVWRDQPQWQEKVPSARGPREMTVGTFRASLLRVDGGVLCLGEFGHLLWLDLSPQGCRILARTWLFAATETWTPPVLSRGLLYVGQNTRDTVSGTPPRLLCYDLRAAAPAKSSAP